MKRLSLDQSEALRAVKTGTVKYVRYPIGFNKIPYFTVNGNKMYNTRTFVSLINLGLVKHTKPSLLPALVVLNVEPYGHLKFSL